jgi:hypothetical protein
MESLLSVKEIPSIYDGNPFYPFRKSLLSLEEIPSIL